MSFKTELEFPRQKLNKFMTKAGLTRNVKRTSSGKEKAIIRNKKIMTKKV